MGFISELIGTPLGWIMWAVYYVVQNYGIAIILFTLVTKILMLPLSYKQQLGSIRTQALNPKLRQLRKEFANNPQKLQMEQQKLYQEEGVNPMGSCLPMIVTMIILYGVFDVVYRPLTHILRIKDSIIDKLQSVIIEMKLAKESSFDSRPELKILDVVKKLTGEKETGLKDKLAEVNVDAAVVDEIQGFENTFLGIDLGDIPSFSPDTWNKAAILLVMIPILSGLIQLLFTLYTQRRTNKMNPDMEKVQGSGCMNIMLYGMPLFSVYLAATFPAGVGFYWIWSSVFSFLQSFLLYQWFTPKRVEAINAKIKESNKNKKPTMMQRMLEQQNEMMKQGGGSYRPDYNADTEKMSRSEKQNYNRKLINEARKRMAEKYGEVYDENDDED